MFNQIVEAIGEAAALIRQEDMSAFLLLGKWLCIAIGTVVLVKKYAAAIDYGDGIVKLSDFTHYFFVYFALLVYQPLITGMDKVFESFASTASPSAQTMESFVRNLENSEKAMDENQLDNSRQEGVNNTQLINDANEFAENAAQTDDRNWFRTEFEKIKENLGSVNNKISGFFNKFSLRNLLFMCVQYMLIFGAKIAFVILVALSAIARTFFAVLGPFVLGLSLIPTWESWASNFFAKYLSFCFWLPAQAFVINLGVKVANLTFLLRENDSDFFSLNGPDNINALGPAVITGLLIIIAGSIFVPKLVSKLFGVAGSSGGAMTTAARAVAAAATKGMIK